MSAAPAAYLVTLGCARNDVDSDELAGRLLADGWSLADSATSADVVLVNTCGFISAAKADSIETILELSDGVPVVATGCMAERYGEQLARELPEAAAVLGFDHYPTIGQDLRAVLAGERIPSHEPKDRRTLLPITPSRRAAAATVLPGHDTSATLGGAADRILRHRLVGGPVAPLKIASGCDRRCAFCAIPSFRGAFVSRPVAEVVAEARALAADGVREVVLVSENSTAYGKDIGSSLDQLLRHLAVVEDLVRIRVSYLQPAEVRPTLLDVMADLDRVAPYFDLSFQHASAPVLRRMRRFGDAESFLSLIDQIRQRQPAAGIRSNVIVGFPGETEQDLQVLLDFLDAARLDAVGVFGYSDEDGTEATALPGKVAAEVIDGRVAEVAELVDVGCAERAAARVGSTVSVLVEDPAGDEVGRAEFQGPEDGACRLVAGAQARAGEMITATVADHEGADLLVVSGGVG